MVGGEDHPCPDGYRRIMDSKGNIVTVKRGGREIHIDWTDYRMGYEKDFKREVNRIYTQKEINKYELIEEQERIDEQKRIKKHEDMMARPDTDEEKEAYENHLAFRQDTNLYKPPTCEQCPDEFASDECRNKLKTINCEVFNCEYVKYPSPICEDCPAEQESYHCGALAHNNKCIAVKLKRELLMYRLHKINNGR